ncbi:Gustatory receptor 87 [Frankliniella occidentalis]|nr:Gustatory receptor 87 [Frankliniella occidentalis]
MRARHFEALPIMFIRPTARFLLEASPTLASGRTAAMVRCVALPLLRLVGILAAVTSHLPVAGWPFGPGPPRPWSKCSAYATMVLVFLALELPTSALAGDSLHSEFIKARGAHVATWAIGMLRVLALAAGAGRRAALAELVQCVRAYCDRHPMTARGWRAVLATLMLVPLHFLIVGYFLALTVMQLYKFASLLMVLRIVYAYASAAIRTIVPFVVVLLPAVVIGSLAADLRHDCLLQVTVTRGRRHRAALPFRLSRMYEWWPSPAPRVPPSDLWPRPPSRLQSLTPATGAEWAAEKGLVVKPMDLWPALALPSATSGVPGRVLWRRVEPQLDEIVPLHGDTLEPLAWRTLRQRQQLLFDICLAAYSVYQWWLLFLVLNTLLYETLHLSNVVHALHSIKMGHIMQNFLVSSRFIGVQDREEITLFMEQINIQESHCSVLGLFVLDTVTMMAVISGISSYVVVMIQFQVNF